MRKQLPDAAVINNALHFEKKITQFTVETLTDYTGGILHVQLNFLKLKKYIFLNMSQQDHNENLDVLIMNDSELKITLFT